VISGRVAKGDWNLDIFDVNKKCGGFVLPFLGIQIFKVAKFMEEFDITLPVLEEFLEAIHFGYKETNPYHNANHGADVMYTMHCFFYCSSRLKSELSSLDAMSAIVSAAVHDFKHDGKNNSFHKETLSQLAIQFNDQSPLENMHVSEAFKVLQQPRCNIFKSLSKDDFNATRQNIIRMVLSTDMGVHFNHVADFRSKLKAEHHSGTPQVPHDLVLEMCLHVADISNATKSSELYTQWANLVMEEFFQQGDVEKDEGMSPVPMFDRDAVNMGKAQSGFIDYIVKPTYELWGEYLFEFRDVFEENLAKNRAIDWSEWKPKRRGEWETSKAN